MRRATRRLTRATWRSVARSVAGVAWRGRPRRRDNRPRFLRLNHLRRDLADHAAGVGLAIHAHNAGGLGVRC